MITQTVIKEAGVGKDVKYWERIKRQYLVHSLDKLTKVGTSIHDILPNEDTDVAEQATDLAVVERMLETLKAKGGDQGETMARIIARRYGLDYEEPATYTELAGQLGISRDTVKSLEKYALMLLRTITVI
jgi:DNA-directed RNA polymerase sigma subunit (sigma70/sigma32)